MIHSIKSIPDVFLIPLKTTPIPFVYLNDKFECLYANNAFCALFQLSEKSTFKGFTSEEFLKNTLKPEIFLQPATSSKACTKQYTSKAQSIIKQKNSLSFLSLIPQVQSIETSPEKSFQKYAQAAKENQSAKFNWLYKNKANRTRYIEIILYYVSYENQDLFACHINELEDDAKCLMREEYGFSQYRDFISSIPLYVHLWDENLNLLDCAHEMVDLFGLPSKEYYLNNFMEYSPEYQPNGMLSSVLSHQQLQEAFREGKAHFLWTHFDPRTQEYIPGEVTLVRVKWGDKNYVLGYLTDKREHLRNLEEINDAYDMFKIMNDTMPICSFIFAPDFSMVDCNQEVARILKTTKEEYLQNYRNYIPRFQADGVPSLQKGPILYQEAMESGYARFEWLFKDAEGVEVPTDLTLYRIKYHGQIMLAAFAIDLRESKTFIRQMQEHNERNQLILDALPIGVAYWNKEHKIIACNNALLKLLKIPNLAYYKKNFATLLPKVQANGINSRERIHQVLDEAFEKGIARTEFERLDSTKNSVYVDTTAVRLMQDGTPFVAVYSIDLTAIRASEKQIFEVSERVQIMFDAFPMCAILWDKKLHALDCNMEAINLLGYSSKEAYLNYASDLNPESLPIGREYYKDFFNMIRKTFKTGYEKFEWESKHKDGYAIPVEAIFILVKNNNEDAVVGYLRDLRAEKKMLKNLEEAHERVQIMLNTFPMGANFWNKDLRIIDCNLEVVKLLGYDTKEEYLSTVSQLSADNILEGREYAQKVYETISNAFISGYEQIEWVTIHKDGYLIPVERTFIRVQNEKGDDFIIGYMRDLREQQKMLQELIDVQENLRAVKEVAEQNANIKSEFLAHMSHEIRTPMNGVIGLLHLLLSSNLVGVQEEYAKKTLAAARHLLRVVNDILDLSIIEKGKFKLENVPVDFDEICKNAEEIFRAKADAKNLSFNIIRDENTDGAILGDPFRLRQVLFNIIGNAVKFTEKGGIEVCVTCKEATDTQKTFLFSVKDTGIGLTKEQIAKLFSAFAQAESFITRQYGGTGLGLLIAKNMVEAMHGEIWVESEYGVSSTFSFTVVFDLCSEMPQEEVASCVQSVDQKMLPESALHTHENLILPVSAIDNGKKVLLVEDNKINQLVASELLKKNGYQIALAENGQEAIDRLHQEMFDIILMDIQMPVMDGLTASKEIRKESKFDTIPIIAVSAHTMEGDKEICIEHGMNDHVRKPISPPELFMAMEKCLAVVL